MSIWKYAGALAGGPYGFAAGATLDANNAQKDAAKQAQEQNAALINQQMQNQQAAGYTANDLLYGALPGVQDYFGQGYSAALDPMTQGYGQQRQDLLNGGGQAAGAIAQGQGLSLDQLYSGAGQGIGYVNSGLQSGTGAINARTDRSGALLDQQGGLYGGLQMDPGYEFRRSQGQQAIQNMQAAQGGRLGGAAAKALVDYNQNFASNEYNNAANRRLQEYGAAQGADSQSLAAQNSLANLYAGAGSQAAGMAYGAGQGGANIYGQGASQLANIYSGMGQQLGQQAANAGQSLGQLGQGYYNQLGNLDWQAAQQMGNNVMNAANAGQQLVGAGVANNNAMVPYAGQNDAAMANMANQFTQLGAMAYMGGAFRPAPMGYNPAAVEGTAQFVGPPRP